MNKVADEYRKKAEAAERSARKARTDFEKQGFLRIAKGKPGLAKARPDTDLPRAGRS